MYVQEQITKLPAGKHVLLHDSKVVITANAVDTERTIAKGIFQLFVADTKEEIDAEIEKLGLTVQEEVAQ